MKEKILILIVLLFLINPLVRAETKPVYLVLFEKEVKSELVQDLINKKQHQFSFKIESLIDLKIPNDPTALTKYFNSISNLEYVLFMGNLKPRTETIDFPEYGYQARLNTDFFVDDLPIGRWPFEISVPVVKEKAKKIITSGIFPICQFRQYLGSWEGKKWHLKGYNPTEEGERIKSALHKQGIQFSALYETEGLGPDGNGFEEQPQPDFVLNESTKIFNQSHLVFLESGKLQFPADQKNNIIPYHYFSSPQRIIWREDLDKDSYADCDEEIEITPLVPADEIQKQNRIAFVLVYLDSDQYIDTVAQNSIITIVPKIDNRITQLPFEVGKKAAIMSSGLNILRAVCLCSSDLPQDTIGKFIHSKLPELYQGSDTKYSHQYKYSVLSLEIYGDPSVTLSELADFPHPQLVLKPETVDRNLLIVLGKKNSYELTLKNVGQLDLQWKILEIPKFIKTNKISGTIKPNKETVITLTLNDVEYLIAPQTQTGLLVLETNDPDRKLIKIKIKLII